jgi:hypothetical protein
MRCAGKRGKKPVGDMSKVLKLEHYTSSSFLQHPAAWDWTPAVPSPGMLGNDTVGDCTVACMLHLMQLWCYLNKKPFDPTAAQALSLYSAITGYDPAQTQPDGSNPTDQGADPTAVLQYAQKVGMLDHKIRTFLSINPQDINHIKAAIYWFGGVYAGVNLPGSAEQEFNAGQEWKIQSLADLNNPLGGHAIPLMAFGLENNGQTYFTCDTWAAYQRMTGNWWWGAGMEVFAVLSDDWVASGGQAPNGFDDAALTADLQLVGDGSN